MRKLFTIIFAGLLSITAAKAQVDLEVTMPYPVYHQSITSGADLLTDVVVKNVGGNTFQSTDQIYYIYSIDYEMQTIKINGDPNPRDTFFLTGRQLLPGDTMHISRIFKLKFPAAKNGERQYCLEILEDQSVLDPNLANNDACQLVLLTGGYTTGVNDIENVNTVLQVSPNPAYNEVNIKLDMMKKNAVTVKLLDMTGRTVTQQVYNTLNAGEHTLKMNTGDVPQGVYMYQVQMGDNKSSGKLVISK